MADVHWKFVNGNLVFYDTHRRRWIDAYGPNVIKWELPRVGMTFDDQAAALPTNMVTTHVDVGASSTDTTAGTAAGIGVSMVTAKNEYDGVNMTGQGSNFQLVANKPLYFGCKFETTEATSTDILFGLADKRTALLTAAVHTIHASTNDGIGFFKADGAATMACWAEKNTASSLATTAGTITGSSADTVEMYWSGHPTVSSATLTYYFNGVEMKNITATTNIPTVVLTPAIAFRNGAASTARTCNVHWMRVIQLDT
jgi:hypothetical protein